MSMGVEVVRGGAPLIVLFPHTGTELPAEIRPVLVSTNRAIRDTDWFIHELYGFAAGLGATTIRTPVSRTAIDVNRDPSGQSLYPGMATTELCPTTTFDGDPLYRDGRTPDAGEIARRKTAYFDPFHAALDTEIARLKAIHGRVVVYDCHSIRSVIPRLFDGELPHFNIGTNAGASCDPRLTDAVAGLCAATTFSSVVNGRFKGGWITPRCGRPADGVHAVQMELGIRGYMVEPSGDDDIPAGLDPAYSAPMRKVLVAILNACLAFAQQQA